MDADSIVALDATTGRELWAFQTVHHNLWDYDVAAEPLLFTFHGTPAVAVATKTGMLFVLNRLTGAPLIPVDERPVPASGIAGETASATQPISQLPGLAPLTFTPRPAGVGSRAGDLECSTKLSHLRYDGMYTPPSLGGTLVFPGSLGGVNWGSGAFDPETGTYYANTNRLPFEVRLIPRGAGRLEQIAHDPPWYYGLGSALVVVGLSSWWMRSRQRSLLGVVAVGLGLVVCGVVMESHPFIAGGSLAHFGVEISEQRGTPFWVYRAPLVDAEGLPCTAPPWGALTAMDLEHHRKLFETPIGSMREGAKTGMVGLGGPVVTKGGLVFTASSKEAVLRALDKHSGVVLWEGRLPVSAQATPMIYTLKGREYVLICAGGHGAFGSETGDSVVAFALP